MNTPPPSAVDGGEPTLLGPLLQLARCSSRESTRNQKQQEERLQKRKKTNALWSSP